MKFGGGDCEIALRKNLKINENNSHFPIDKWKSLCYTQLVNKNGSQIGGANGATM
jgi:hypothetical protein